MIQKRLCSGGGIVDLKPEGNIDIMVEVMSDLDLHLKASKGYKYTGTTVDLNGEEDSNICRGHGFLAIVGDEKPHQLRGGGG